MEITNKNYRAYPAINYSTLSSLDKNPADIGKDTFMSDGLRKGDILDILCFEPERLKEEYFISSLESLPTDAIKAIIDESPSMEDKDLIQTSRILNFGGANWGDDTRLKKIKEGSGQEYIDNLSKAEGKPILSMKDYKYLYDARTILFNHPFTKHLFKNADFQVPYLGKVNDSDNKEVDAKCLLDIKQDMGDYVLITDLKFSSSPLKLFPREFIKWRYYLQGSLYSDVVESVEKKPIVFQYIIFSSVNSLPAIFRLSNNDRMAGKVGGILNGSNKKIKGYQQLIKEYYWHIENKLVDYPYEVYENNGVLELNAFSNEH